MSELRKMTAARRARLLKQPGWYEQPAAHAEWARPCMVCKRKLNPGDVVRDVPGATLVKMQRLGACCEPKAKPVLEVVEQEQTMSVLDYMWAYVDPSRMRRRDVAPPVAVPPARKPGAPRGFFS